MSEPESNEEKTRRVAPRGRAVLLCVLLIITGGVTHGYLDGRWTHIADAKLRGTQLQDLPKTAGNWRLLSSEKIPDSAQRTLQCYGSVLRDYVHDITGDRIKVFVVLGPRGPTAVHTPEVCYSSTGTEPAGERVAKSLLINGETQTLWNVKFRRPRTSDPPHLEVWYGWSDGGPWNAASLPRVWLTDSLYKIQVAGPPAKPDQEISPVEDFLKEFLPSFQETIASTSENGSAIINTPSGGG